MKQGELVNDFRVPPHPKGISLEGSLVTLKPLTASQFANELFLSNLTVNLSMFPLNDSNHVTGNRRDIWGSHSIFLISHT